MYRPPLETILRIASAASAHGPKGFSLALIITASGGAPRTCESCASADSLKNGRVEPAVSIVAKRPKLRREKPRLRNSFFSAVVSVKFFSFCFGQQLIWHRTRRKDTRILFA